MLTSQQLAQLKSATSPQAMATQPMTPEQAKASFSSSQSNQPSRYEVAMGIKNPDGTQNTTPGIIPQAVSQIKSGFEQTQRGAQNPDIIAGGKDIIAGTLNEAGGALRGIFSPVEAVMKDVAQLPGASQALDAIKNYIINPSSEAISKIPAVQKFVMANPNAESNISNAISIATALIGGAKAPEIKGAVTEAGTKIADTGTNVMNKVSDIAGKTTETIGNAIDKTNPLNLVPDTASANIMNKVARLTPTDATKFENLAGMSHGEYLAKSGNFGSPESIITNEATKFVKSLDTVDSEMAKLPGTYESPALKTAMNDLVTRESKVSTPGAPSPDLATINELNSKLNNGGLTMAEINTVKRIYERNIKLDYARQNLPTETARATNVDTALRNWQTKTATDLGLTNLPELNKQTQISKFIIDKLGKQLVGKTGLNTLGLTDWIMLSGGNPSSVVGFLTKKFFSSKGVQARIAKMISEEPSIGQIQAKTSITPENINRQVNPQGFKALPAPAEGAPLNSKTSGQTIPVAPKGFKGDLTSKEGIIPTKQATPPTPKIEKSTSPKSTTPTPKVKVASAKTTPETALINEAKKYKSAEDFVKAQGEPILHGTNKRFSVFDISKRGTYEQGQSAKNAFWFTSSKDTASSYGSNIKSVYAKFDKPITIDAKGQMYGDMRGKIDEAILNAKKNGNDGVIIKNLSDRKDWGNYEPATHYGILDMSKIKTKSQLTDIWNKANKK